MTITRDNTTALQDAPDVILDLIRLGIVSDLFLHVENEAEDFLIRESMERTGKTGKAS